MNRFLLKVQNERIANGNFYLKIAKFKIATHKYLGFFFHSVAFKTFQNFI